MSETVEQFLARGGQVQSLPIGQCNWDALSNRAKINPQVLSEEMKAKKARKLPVPFHAEPAPKPKKAKPSRAVVKVRKVRPPKVAKPPKAPKPKAAPKPKKPAPFARDGSDKARILALVGSDWTTVKALCDQTGIAPNHVRESLRLLKARGLVEFTGDVFNRYWRKPGGEAPPVPDAPARPRTGLSAKVLEAVHAGHARVAEIAEVTKAHPRHVSVRLWHLSRGGLVELEGRSHSARWRPVNAAARG